MLPHISSNQLINRTTLLFGIGFFIVLMALVVNARAWFKPSVQGVDSSIVSEKTTDTPNAVSQGDPKEERFEAELITIRTTGFEPSELTRAKGKFLLAVDNRAELEEVQLKLQREGGDKLHDVRVPREVLDWNQIVDLHPGTYILTEANHPDWVCRITITPK